MLRPVCFYPPVSEKDVGKLKKDSADEIKIVGGSLQGLREKATKIGPKYTPGSLDLKTLRKFTAL